MFDLEQSIAEWRARMLAAGIKTPVPLEELESHLREEIERQVKSGFDRQEAFEIATRQIGQAGALKNEFKTSGVVEKATSISWRFSIGMLAISGVASGILGWIQFVTLPSLDKAFLASVFKPNALSLLNLYEMIAMHRQYADFVRVYLVLSLILAALFTLLCFRLSKHSHRLQNI